MNFTKLFSTWTSQIKVDIQLFMFNAPQPSQPICILYLQLSSLILGSLQKRLSGSKIAVSSPFIPLGYEEFMQSYWSTTSHVVLALYKAPSYYKCIFCLQWPIKWFHQTLFWQLRQVTDMDRHSIAESKLTSFVKAMSSLQPLWHIFSEMLGDMKGMFVYSIITTWWIATASLQWYHSYGSVHLAKYTPHLFLLLVAW